MKKLLIILIFSGTTLIANSQADEVERSIFGIQTGLLGIWVHNESKLTSQISLRYEIGFDAGVWGGFNYDKTEFLLAPVFTLEPRWYYNLKRRKSKSRRVDGNSGNFVSLKTSYHPDWFVISSQDNINIRSDLSIVPTWGINRNISSRFTYEAGIGIGYAQYFNSENASEFAVNLHLRIGYRIK